MPEAASQIWKLIPFSTVAEAPENVKVQLVEVLPAEVPSDRLLEVSCAAKALIGSSNETIIIRMVSAAATEKFNLFIA